MTIALTRDVSPELARCQLTHLDRTPIDVELARRQHNAYCRLLESLGCEILVAEAAPGLPDSVFVEDTALVLDEAAILCRPGAESRRAEVAGVAEALEPYRKLLAIEAPGTLDGGDLLRVGRTIYAGLTTRSNGNGIEQLAQAAGRFGYTVKALPVAACLHLKSAVTALGDETLLLNPDWIDAANFPGFELIEIAPGEPNAANAVSLDGRLVYPENFPRTREKLERRGYEVHTVAVSELQKAEGAVSCCSILL